MSYTKKICVYMSFNIKRHIYTSVISWCFSHDYHVSQSLSSVSPRMTWSTWNDCYYLAHFFETWLVETLLCVHYMTSIGRAWVRSDDNSGPREVCHALQKNCLMFWQGAATHHLRMFNVRYQPFMSPGPCPTQAHQSLSNTRRRAPEIYKRTKVIFPWFSSK